MTMIILKSFFSHEDLYKTEETVLLNVDVSLKSETFSSTCLNTSFSHWNEFITDLSFLLDLEVIQISALLKI